MENITLQYLKEHNYPEYLDSVCKIHKSAYHRDHFTSRFSDKKLKEFYENLIHINTYCFIAIDDDNRTVGFIIAGYNTNRAVKRFTSENKLYLSGLILRHPQFFVKKITAKIDSYFSSKNKSLASLRLLSIAVDSSIQSKGIGAEMIRQFEAFLKNNNEQIYGLSVKKSNNAAVKFYKKNGYNEEYQTKDAVFYIKKIA